MRHCGSALEWSQALCDQCLVRNLVAPCSASAPGLHSCTSMTAILNMARYMWKYKHIPPVLRSLICSGIGPGVDSVDARGNMELARRPLGLPRLDTAPNKALHAVLDELRSQRGAYMCLRVARRCACAFMLKYAWAALVPNDILCIVLNIALFLGLKLVGDRECDIGRDLSVYRGDAVESAFFASLSEDKTEHGVSYVEFLTVIHKLISQKNR